MRDDAILGAHRSHDLDVYFDDIRVVHGQGLQVQESEYDPTGLELAGLSGTTPGLKRLSQYKWNGKEFQTDLGLNWTQLDWRMFDPQLNHMPVVDPEVENGQESMSPYAFGYDNAVRFNDPNGRCPGDCPPTQATVSQHKPNVAEVISTTNAVVGSMGNAGLNLASMVGTAAYNLVNQVHEYATGFFDREKATTLEGHSVNRADYQMAGFGTVMLIGSFGMVEPAVSPSPARFIVTADGTTMFSNINEGRAALENAGYKGTPTTGYKGTTSTETGTTHQLPYKRPNGSKGTYSARLMNGQPSDATGLKGPRVVTTRQAHTTEYVLPNGKDLPKGTPLPERKGLGHTHLPKVQ